MLFVQRHTQLRTKSSTTEPELFFETERACLINKYVKAHDSTGDLVNEQTSTDVEHNTHFTRIFWRQRSTTRPSLLHLNYHMTNLIKLTNVLTFDIPAKHEWSPRAGIQPLQSAYLSPLSVLPHTARRLIT